ncbi:rhomboid family intramembrane serine protease [Segetibacter sp.]|jgi:membrane associated rhomboid family serine protease|uniref:rhomboid family intramembrane serine protease n=1 Tax=Segetibacter sp. TaxID=2231182 RepID=UPI002615FC2B|nr:rhomboid family intramembrane serine protease [Segetibacter sp.]MCW3081573.1 rhomboid family intrarane serine protease [Segetibacter sp.]
MSITLIIIIITSIVSFSAFSNQKVTDQLIFYPPAVTNQKQWYRFFSCALIHADITHLLFNMFSFYSFGEMVEGTFKYLFGSLGSVLFIALYVISQFLCLLPTYSKHKDDYYYRSLGASGAVSAIIFAGIFLNPLAKMGILFIPIGIPGFIFGFIYLGITAYLDRRGASGINHSAHLFGALAGIGLLLVFGYAFSQYDLLQNFISQIRSFSI